MTALYLLMVFSPLASFAMHGTKSAAVGIRECVGDCDLCGCSPESRASQTCCCARKKQQQAVAHNDHQDAVSDCCSTKPAQQAHVGEQGGDSTPDCCSTKPDQQARVGKQGDDSTPDCCAKESAPQKQVIISCGCPCGNGKQSALTIAGTSEVLPFSFTEQLTIPATTTTYSNLTHRLTSRFGEPPDPPPKQPVSA